MKCIACGKAQMVHRIHDISHSYKGQTTTIKDVPGYYCAKCNESLHNADEAAVLNAAMLAFNKEVNAASVDPEFISTTRKRLKLDQQEAADLFGGGVNAFSRYETGKTKPSLALVQLFKILNKHPHLLKEIQPTDALEASASNTATKSRLSRRSDLIAKSQKVVPIKQKPAVHKEG